MIACASARAPDKADNSPFPELFALRRIVRRQMCVKRFKAVGMPYDDASSIASLPSCENDRTGSGGMDRCGQAPLPYRFPNENYVFPLWDESCLHTGCLS